jgi:heptosyltransferase-2
VVLATAIVEKLRLHYPHATIDFLVRKGNESLLAHHPYLRQVLVFDKKNNKYTHLRNLIREIRKHHYDYVINAQRFFTSGLMTVLSGAKEKIGFDKNPLSAFFTVKVPHHISAQAKGDHEVKRDLQLIAHLTDDEFIRPRLYPAKADFEKVKTTGPYICIAPASVWFTKQYPKEGWIALIKIIPPDFTVYLMGSKSDFTLCDEIRKGVPHNQVNIRNLAGQLSFLESAALMKHAEMNYVNDSAPLHFASAVNAPVTAVFCSTVPAFGFGPLSDKSFIVETKMHLDCRPCGLHGKKACPLGHFHCSIIDAQELLSTIYAA